MDHQRSLLYSCAHCTMMEPDPFIIIGRQLIRGMDVSSAASYISFCLVVVKDHQIAPVSIRQLHRGIAQQPGIRCQLSYEYFVNAHNSVADRWRQGGLLLAQKAHKREIMQPEVWRAFVEHNTMYALMRFFPMID